VLAAVAQRRGRNSIVTAAKVAAAGGAVLSLAALVKDLGRPLRAFNMLRVVKPTSPMSVGTWLLSGYAPAAVVAAASEVTGLLPAIGTAATVTAAGLGPAIASYTAVLISDTAVPAWHDGRHEMPFVFTASAAIAAAGVGLLVASDDDAGPVRRLAVGAAAAELAAEQLLERRLDPMVATAYHRGKPEQLLRTSRALAVVGATGALAGRRSVAIRRLAGTALLASSALTRFGIFHAGMGSAHDPAATVEPQRARLAASSQPDR
jgi:DMSO reductase anchor subunit